MATWNVGGKSPHSGLNLDALLHVHSEYDIYVLGYKFQSLLSIFIDLCIGGYRFNLFS